MLKNTFLFILLSLFLAETVKGQTTTDAIMMQPGEICLVAGFEHSWFDHYWEGPLLRTNATVATVNRNTAFAGAAVGLIDRLNFLFTIPYVQTYSSEPNGGKFAGARGIQDLNVALKYDLIDRETSAGTFQVLTNIGYSTRLSNYLSDYRPYSIGSGNQEVNIRGIAQFRSTKGYYGRGSLAYLWRGQTKAERDYYYNNGSYFTAWMDVPSAVHYQLVAGKWMLDSHFKAEVSFTGLQSLSGDDIRFYNAAQPTNRVHAGIGMVNAQYYFKAIQGLGVLGYYGYTLSGRNTGKAQMWGGGVTYQFPIW
ncbi:MAG: transporter [Saprospiraceae bacterium]|nr:transporter [Saprospiraceae bacterium]